MEVDEDLDEKASDPFTQQIFSEGNLPETSQSESLTGRSAHSLCYAGSEISVQDARSQPGHVMRACSTSLSENT